MKKKIITLFSLFIVGLTMFGCNKVEENTNTIKVDPKDKINYEEINDLIEENKDELLKENISLGNGYILIPPSIDIENNEQTLDLYVHMNNPKFSYETTNFVNYLITATSEEASYMYSFYEKENGDMSPYIFLPIADIINDTNVTMDDEYNSNKIGNNNILEYNYEFSIDNSTFYVKLLCLEIDNETILMCHRISEDKFDVDLEKAFLDMFDTLTITKK